MRKTLALLLIFLAVILAQFSVAPQPAQAAIVIDDLPLMFVNGDYCITYSGSLFQWYCGSDPKIISTNGIPNSQQWKLLPRSGSRTQVNIRTVKADKCMQYASTTDTISMVTCDLTKIEQC